MSDLRIEDTIFEDLKRTFSTISDRMETARRTLRHADGSVVGAPHLINEVHDFADDWGYGVKQLGKHTENAIKMINRIGSTFDKLDLELAESLKSPRAAKAGGSESKGALTTPWDARPSPT